MIIKCKMCGGDIEFTPGATYGTCEYCGSTSTIPVGNDENKLNRYNRANHFRRQCEFDKAVAAYEKILEQDDTDAEAHWGAVISRFGIEYVEDPATHKRIPTCHRVQLTSILADEDYKAAVQYAPDAESRRLYEEEAARIAEIQKGILAISQNEKPYDVFICYKETDENGQRTHDSQWAQDVYYGLTEQGYKVFFSRITLEDKLGQEYEPYIFAALNSAKVMIVIGSRPEYFNAVWVKNEWSRFLALMANDRSRLLIPCYRGMDPYDLPDELSSLQSQDISKIGFMQDLIRGVRKVLDVEKKQDASKAQPAAAQSAQGSIASLLRRVFLFLEDEDWRSANEYCEKVLDLDPENAQAYLGKLMADYGVRKPEDLATLDDPFDDDANYQKIMRFGSEAERGKVQALAKGQALFALRNKLPAARSVTECVSIRKAMEELGAVDTLDAALAECDARIEEINRRNYDEAVRLQNARQWNQAILAYQAVGDYRDSREKIAECEECIRDAAYRNASKKEQDHLWEDAAKAFDALGDYRGSAQRAAACRAAKAEEDRQAAERRERERREAEEKARAASRKRRNVLIFVLLAAAAALVVVLYVIPKGHYDKAVAARAAQNWEEAVAEFTAAGIYSDAATQALATRYAEGEAKRASQNWSSAVTAFEQAGNYSDAPTQITETKYLQAKSLTAKGNYAGAVSVFVSIKGYKDVDSLLVDDKNLSAAVREPKIKPYKTIGNIVTFGKYEARGTWKTKPIEWLVLDYDAKKNRALLLSRYGLEDKLYHQIYRDVTWEECDLRAWLNGLFLKLAFSAEEEKAILTTTVDNSSSQGYRGWNTIGGNDTQDKVFLLSYAEVQKYLSPVQRNAKTATDYPCGWWLRSPGDKQSSAAYMDFGELKSASVNGPGYNYSIMNKNGGVRPALWLNLESDIF